MNTARTFPRVSPDKENQLFTADLSCVSRSHLTALSNKLYKELDTVAPDPRTRDRYDALVQEIEFRNDPSIDRGDDAQGS